MVRGLGLRSLGESILQTVFRYLVALAVGLGLSILLARILGPDGNGKYAVAILLPSLLSNFLNLGIGPANVYYVGRGSVSVRTALSSNLKLWLVLAGVGVVAAVLAIEFRADAWFPGVPEILLWLVVPAFPLALARMFCQSLLQGRQDFGRYNLALLVTPTSTLVLAAAAIWAMDFGVVGAIAAFTLGHALGLAYSYSATTRISGGDGGMSPGIYEKRALSYGWRAHLANVLGFLNYRADLFLVNLLIAPAAAGVYVITIQIAERLWILSRSVSTVLLPRLSELHDEEDVRRQLTPLAARWVGILSTVAALVLAPLAPPLVDLLFGSEYAGAAEALQLLLVGVVAGAVARVLTNDIAARGRPELNMMTAGAVLVVNVVANVLLIPEFGINGAAGATAIAYLLHATLTVAIYSHLSGNRWWRPLLVGREDWTAIKALLEEAGLLSP